MAAFPVGADGQQPEIPDDSALSTKFDVVVVNAAPDHKAANGIQKGLRQIGRRPGRLRALRVHASPIDMSALDQSRYLITVLSPAAAASDRVDADVAHWLQHHGLDRLLLVLAGGHLSWDAEQHRFDPTTSDAAPPALTRPDCLPAEPFFMDVSADAPWDPETPAFRDKVTALAAPIHGKPKDQLAGDDVREQRRFRRLRAAAVLGMVVLLAVSAAAGTAAAHSRRDAIAARDRSTAQRLNVEAHGMLTGSRLGGDIRAFPQLLAARGLAPGDDGPLLYAAAERATTSKIIEAGAAVNYVTVSPDGRRIASADADGSVRLWDAGSGAALPGPPQTIHGEAVLAVAFSSDGHRLALPDDQNAIHIWDIEARREAGTPLRGHTNLIRSLAFSRDGRWLASGGEDGLRLWDPATGQQSSTIAEGAETLSVRFSQDSRRLAILTDGGDIRQWDPGTGQPIGRSPRLPPAGDTDTVAAFSPDGHHVVSGGVDGTVRLWSTDDGLPVAGVNEHTQRPGVWGAAYSADGKLIALANNDGSVGLLNAEDLSQISEPLTGHTDSLAGVAFSTDGTRLVTGGNDHTIRVWDLTQLLTGNSDSVWAVAFSSDGRLVSGSADGTVRLWDPHTGRQIGAPLSEGTAGVLSVAFNGRAVASSAGDGTIRLTELVSGRTTQFSVGEPASTVAFSPDGRLLASGSKAGVDLWNAADGSRSGPALANNSSPPIGTLAFDPRGHRIAAADGQGRDIAIWDLATRRTVAGPLTGSPPSRVLSLTFSPDGRRLAAAYEDNTVRLWNVDTGAQYTDPLRGHTDRIWSVAFSPNGDRVASGGVDGTVRVWAADTGRPLAGAFTGHYREVYAVAFSPDGTRIASAGEDTTIRMWPAVVTPQMLCDKLGPTARTVTPEQWREWISPDIGYAPPCPAPYVGS